MTQTKKIVKNILADVIEILIIGIAVFALAWIFLAEPLEVTGDSMKPTLQTSEQIIVEKLSMNFGEIESGDIVVFNSPEDPSSLIIKRVIGLPGDKINIRNGKVFVNEEVIEEPYLEENTTTDGKRLLPTQTIKVPYEQYFVLGDNRVNSTDSRDFGTINEDEIVGKAVFVYFPVGNMRKINTVQ